MSQNLAKNKKLLLIPWRGVFFERIVRGTKTLLRKTLQIAKLTNEELQTVYTLSS